VRNKLHKKLAGFAELAGNDIGLYEDIDIYSCAPYCMHCYDTIRYSRFTCAQKLLILCVRNSTNTNTKVKTISSMCCLLSTMLTIDQAAALSDGVGLTTVKLRSDAGKL